MNACSHLVRGYRDDEAASYTHPIGETPFTIKTITNPKGSSVALVKLHDDETTAEKAASEVLNRYGGSLLTIENGGERLRDEMFLLIRRMSSYATVLRVT